MKVRVVGKGKKKSKPGKVRFTYVGTTVPPVTPTPPTPPEVPTPAALAGSAAAVDCSAPSTCMAVGRQQGTSGEYLPAAYRLASGTWAVSPLPALPATPNADPDAELEDISCPTTTFCAAVGRYLNAADHVQSLLLTWNGTTWTASSVLPAGVPADAEAALVALDCVSASSCTAIGGVSSDSTPATNKPLAATWNGTAWSAQSLPQPAGTSSAVVDIDCTAVTECVAVGRHEPVSDDDVFQPFVETLSGTTWTQSLPPAPASTLSSNLQAVSCQATGTCTAVGFLTRTGDFDGLGLVMRLVTGTWTGVAAAAPVDAADDPAMGFADVSCAPTAVTCWAVGAYRITRPEAPLGTTQVALIARISGAGATPSIDSEQVVAPVGAATNTVGFLRRIACSSGNACAAVGSYIADGLGYRPLIGRVSGSPQAATTAATPSGASFAELADLALDSAGSAVGVGYAPVVDGSSKVLLLTGLQVGPSVS